MEYSSDCNSYINKVGHYEINSLSYCYTELLNIHYISSYSFSENLQHLGKNVQVKMFKEWRKHALL